MGSPQAFPLTVRFYPKLSFKFKLTHCNLSSWLISLYAVYEKIPARPEINFQFNYYIFFYKKHKNIPYKKKIVVVH